MQNNLIGEQTNFTHQENEIQQGELQNSSDEGQVDLPPPPRRIHNDQLPRDPRLPGHHPMMMASPFPIPPQLISPYKLPPYGGIIPMPPPPPTNRQQDKLSQITDQQNFQQTRHQQTKKLIFQIAAGKGLSSKVANIALQAFLYQNVDEVDLGLFSDLEDIFQGAGLNQLVRKLKERKLLERVLISLEVGVQPSLKDPRKRR